MEAFIESLFHSVINMSITASVVIAAVMLLRLPLKKAPGAVSYGLWFVVLFRLLCPISFKSAVSIFVLLGSNSSMEHIPADIGTMTQPQMNMIVPGVTDSINAALPAATPAASVNPMQIILFVLAYIWALGVIILLTYSAASYLLLKRRISTATLLQNNIYQTDRISTPFVCGFIKPKIVLPVTLGYDERDYIIRHEETHIRQYDYLVKPLWFLAVCLHWFNPLVWLSFYLMSRDMEMRCDEAVIREMGEDIKVDYSSSLLTLSAAHIFLPGSPLAFGETGIKARVKNVLNYKRPAFWVIAVAVAAVLSATVVLAVNPNETKTEQSLAGQFLQYKTDYVGNNSKVGGIISLLKFPENIRYDSFGLKTNTKPYEVTIKLSASPALKEYYTDTSRQQQFEYNAAVMLSLIGNAGAINFKLSDSENGSPLELVYTKDWADKQYGQDVRLFAGSKEKFAEFLFAKAAAQPTQKQGEMTYTLMKLGKDGKVLKTLSPLNSETKQLAQDVIFNCMIKSTVWPGVNIKTLDNCYLLRVTYSDGTATDYYTFKHEGYSVMQQGTNGMYSRIDDGLYEKLAALLDSISSIGRADRPQAVGVDRTNLDACVADAILSKNANQYRSSDFAAESHVILKTVENGNTTTVYTMALYQEYTYSGSGGGFSETGGSHMPVAITFKKNTAGQYELTEYWIPQDGSYYAPSIKKRFPADIYDKALNTQAYIQAQIQACYEKAIAYGKVDVNAVITKLLKTIAASPASASNPRAYIDAHPIEYRELLYYGKHTLQYCFTLFERGGQTDLNGHIMAAACRNILGDEDIQLLADTGQQWYDAFKKSAENLRNKNGDDYMKKHMPGSYLLLQTLDSAKK